VKIRLIWPGKTRQPWIREGIETYLRRVSAFLPAEVCEVREGPSGPAARRREEEGRRLLRRLPAVGYTVVLDAGGRQLDSSQFARMVGERMVDGRDLSFLVGSVEGLSPEVRERAEMLMSLSRLTLPHDLARLVLAEQVYRALAILKDHPYPR